MTSENVVRRAAVSPKVRDRRSNPRSQFVNGAMLAEFAGDSNKCYLLYLAGVHYFAVVAVPEAGGRRNACRVEPEQG